MRHTSSVSRFKPPVPVYISDPNLKLTLELEQGRKGYSHAVGRPSRKSLPTIPIPTMPTIPTFLILNINQPIQE